MYGKITTARRNLALKLRKELKEKGQIVSGYIVFPAKLLVKKNTNDKQWHVQKDFSKEQVKI